MFVRIMNGDGYTAFRPDQVVRFDADVTVYEDVKEERTVARIHLAGCPEPVVVAGCGRAFIAELAALLGVTPDAPTAGPANQPW